MPPKNTLLGIFTGGKYQTTRDDGIPTLKDMAHSAIDGIIKSQEEYDNKVLYPSGKNIFGQETAPITMGDLNNLVMGVAAPIAKGGDLSKSITKVFEKQNKVAENIVHKDWGIANNYRWNLEASGDILRETGVHGGRFISPDYIYEKANRINKFLNRQQTIKNLRKKYTNEYFKKNPKHINVSDPNKKNNWSVGFLGDTRDAVFTKFNKSNARKHLDDILNAYEDITPVTKSQEIAKDLNLSLIKGDYTKAKKLNDYILYNMDEFIGQGLLPKNKAFQQKQVSDFMKSYGLK